MMLSKNFFITLWMTYYDESLAQRIIQFQYYFRFENQQSIKLVVLINQIMMKTRFRHTPYNAYVKSILLLFGKCLFGIFEIFIRYKFILDFIMLDQRNELIFELPFFHFDRYSNTRENSFSMFVPSSDWEHTTTQTNLNNSN